MKIKWLNLILFAISFALTMLYVHIPGMFDHPRMIALTAFSMGVWPCAVIYTCKL